MLTFHATEQINEVSRRTTTTTTTQVITRYFSRWPQTKIIIPSTYRQCDQIELLLNCLGDKFFHKNLVIILKNVTIKVKFAVATFWGTFNYFLLHNLVTLLNFGNLDW